MPAEASEPAGGMTVPAGSRRGEHVRHHAHNHGHQACRPLAAGLLLTAVASRQGKATRLGVCHALEPIRGSKRAPSPPSRGRVVLNRKQRKVADLAPKESSAALRNRTWDYGNYKDRLIAVGIQGPGGQPWHPCSSSRRCWPRGCSRANLQA